MRTSPSFRTLFISTCVFILFVGLALIKQISFADPDPAFPNSRGNGGVSGQSPVIIHVSPDGSDFYDGSSWELAKKTIAGALAGTTGPSEIWVKNDVNRPYKTKAIITISRSQTKLYGGFTGTEDNLNQRPVGALSMIYFDRGLYGEPTGITLTNGINDITIDGFHIVNISEAANAPIVANNSQVIALQNLLIEDNNYLNSYGSISFSSVSDSTISKVSIKHSKSNSGGAGIKISNSTGITMDNILIEDSVGSWHGGALYLYSSTDVTVTDSRFQDSQTTATGNGGCIAVINGSVKINRTKISGCTSANQGGGLYELGAQIALLDSEVSGNTAVSGGGATFIGGDNYKNQGVFNNIFRHNSATGTGTNEGGGALSAETLQRIVVSDNLFQENTALGYGGAWRLTDTNTTFANNIINLNTAAVAAIAVSGSQSLPNFSNQNISDNHSTVGSSGLYVFDQAKAIFLNELYTSNVGPRAAIDRDETSVLYITYSGSWANSNGTFQIQADAEANRETMKEENPLFLNRNFLTDVMSYQLTPNSPGRDHGQNRYNHDFARAFRPVNSVSDKGAYEYQNIQQNLTMNAWRGPNQNGDQSSALLHYRVYDSFDSLVVDTQAPQGADGFYLVPLGSNPQISLPIKVLISANGYLAKKLTVVSLPNPVSTQLPTGENVTLEGGDTDNNNRVDLIDFNQIAIHFLTDDPSADIDGNGIVGIPDMNIVFINFGLQGD